MMMNLLNSYTVMFLTVNLLFTCVAEEAFFRGFLQENLFKLMKPFRCGPLITVVISGLLFGLVHIGSGMHYVVLSSLVGLGCAYVYLRTKSIEAPILVHFAVNAVHFVGFTYPYINHQS